MYRMCFLLVEMFTYIWIISSLSLFRDVKAFVNVRLENGRGLHEGSVEITTDGYNWEIVCGRSDFDIYDVIVICRQLGYPGANRAMISSPYPTGNYPMSNTAFLCQGTEIHLNDCVLTSAKCNQVAGAACYAQESGYLGCFVDRFTDPVLPEAIVIDNGMTISRCVDYCAINRFAFAGLKFGTKCQCGTPSAIYNKFGRTSDAQCSTPCGGSQFESCGGYDAISVFRVVSNVPPTTFTTTGSLTTRASSASRSYSTQGSGNTNSTEGKVSPGYPYTPAVTVRMVAKEGNFINQPSGMAVVISLSVGMLVLIAIVVLLVKRRSSIPDQKRRPSTRPYEEITLDIKEVPEEENHGSAPNSYCETGDVPPDTPLVVTPPDHTYEQAELFSPGERNSEMYCTVPDLPEDASDSLPNGRTRPETPPAIRDLYAKPLKKMPLFQRNDTSYETINDENLRVDPKTYIDVDRNIPSDDAAPSEAHDGYCAIKNGEDVDSNFDLDAMYAKPLKKEHRKDEDDSVDDTYMVENVLYRSTDS